MQKWLCISTPKNPMSMSNFSAKENTNVEVKSENEMEHKMNHRIMKIS